MSDNSCYNVITNPHRILFSERVRNRYEAERDTQFFEKGGVGMSDRLFFYDDISYVVSEAFRECFGKEIEFVERASDYAQNGKFWLTFRLLEKHYLLTFQSEKDMISVIIKDMEGAEAPLASMCVYANELSEENAIAAVQTLKKVLGEYEPVFAQSYGKNVVLKRTGMKTIVPAAEYRRMAANHECKVLSSEKIVAMLRHA